MTDAGVVLKWEINVLDNCLAKLYKFKQTALSLNSEAPAHCAKQISHVAAYFELIFRKSSFARLSKYTFARIFVKKNNLSFCPNFIILDIVHVQRILENQEFHLKDLHLEETKKLKRYISGDV